VVSLRNRTPSLHGDIEKPLKGLPADLSRAYWISSDRLLCTKSSPPELIIWDLNGHAEKSLKLAHQTSSIKYRYLEESQTLLAAINSPESDHIQLDRYDANSLELVSSSNFQFLEESMGKLRIRNNGLIFFTRREGRIYRKLL
jgi:hypothetical protein